MNVWKTRLIALALVLTAVVARADSTNWNPLPGDGTSPEWCDIASSADVDKDGKTMPETLRDRIEKYNKSGSDSKCRFYMFFLYRNKTIVLKKPLTIENNLHDRDSSSKEVMTGTDISAYGPGGTSDLQGITVDARSITKEEGSCAFVVKGGFAAMQQIHGLTLLVQRKTRAVCDEDGNDLMDAVSLSCDGAKGRDCDFKDVSVLVQPDSGGGTPDDDDADNDGVADTKDLCKGDAITGGEVGNYGCPNTKCVYFTSGLVLTPVAVLQVKSLSLSLRPSISVVSPSLVGKLAISKPVVKDKTGKDSDNDGIDDACDQVDNSPDPCVGADTDDDGTADVCDDDLDGDGIDNVTDPAPYDADADDDGITDGSDPCPLLKDTEPNPDGTCGFEDTDHDGLSDSLEGSLGTDPSKTDTDDDGTPDGSDCLPTDSSRHDCAALVTPPVDTDGDGVPDESDNCPSSANADQADADENDKGDACDTAPEPSGSDKPPAAASQSCGLQLVAPPSDAFTGLLPFLSLASASAGLAAFRKLRKR